MVVNEMYPDHLICSSVMDGQDPVFMFCAAEFVLGGIEDAGSRPNMLNIDCHFPLSEK
jgi:hypothetical protein